MRVEPGREVAGAGAAGDGRGRGSVLIINHVEPEWEFNYNKSVLLGDLVAHVGASRYEDVLLTTIDGRSHYRELSPLITGVHPWHCSWDDPASEWGRRQMADEGIAPGDMLKVSTPQGWAYLAPWMRALKGRRIRLAGGAVGECLSTLEEALTHLGLEHARVPGCVY